MSDAASAGTRQVQVRGLARWMAPSQLLGPWNWAWQQLPGESGGLRALAELSAADAAACYARLRGLVLGGRRLEFECRPALSRSQRRRALLHEARSRRFASVGFSKPGVRYDEEGRYSLTPEALAEGIGKLAVQRWGPDLRVLDACCGLGGNTIGFARAGCKAVEAVEIDRTRLMLARHNTDVYGVGAAVEFTAGDACAHVAGSSADLIFVDPPWGREWKAEAELLGVPPLLEQICAAFVSSTRPSEQPARELWAKLPPALAPERVAPEQGLRCLGYRAIYGVAEGDRNRVKFTLARWVVA